MSAPDIIRASPLVNEAGWVDVNPKTLQHNKYLNIFSIGDCSSLPTSKTAAAAGKSSESGVHDYSPMVCLTKFEIGLGYMTAVCEAIGCLD